MSLIQIYARNGSFVKFKGLPTEEQLEIKKNLRDLFQKEVEKRSKKK